MKGRQEGAQEGFGPITMEVIEVAGWLLSSRKKFQKSFLIGCPMGRLHLHRDLCSGDSLLFKAHSESREKVNSIS